jgi:hypothetical protein
MPELKFRPREFSLEPFICKPPKNEGAFSSGFCTVCADHPTVSAQPGIRPILKAEVFVPHEIFIVANTINNVIVSAKNMTKPHSRDRKINATQYLR